jgi:hypothetical protein
MVRRTEADATDRLIASFYPSPMQIPRWAVMLTLLSLNSRPRRIKNPKMS